MSATKENVPIKLLDPKVDFVFKMLFGKKGNEALLLSLLNAILDRPEGEQIEELELYPVELEREYPDLKGISLDVKAKDQKGRWFDIEIQSQEHLYFPERLLLYWSRIYSNQLKVGDQYRVLNPVISIVFMNFRLKKLRDLEDYHTIYQVLETKKQIPLSDHLEIHLIELPKFHASIEKVDGALEQWVAFLKEGKQMTAETVSGWSTPELAQAWEELQEMSKDPDLWLVYESRMKWILDEEARYYTALTKGREEGRKEGREEGEIIGKLKSANILMDVGMSLSEVSEKLGLSEEEIQQFLDKNM